MLQLRRRDESGIRGGASPSSVRPDAHWSRALAAFVVLFTLVGGSAQSPQQNPNQFPQKSVILPEANRLPDANERMKMQERKNTQQAFDALNAERKKLIADDSTKLVTLAMALKAEADNTGGGTLSPNMLRKAAEIERLAHDVKEKMKVTVEAK